MQTSARIAVTAVVGMVVYLGLAILGWGGVGAFFAHPALNPSYLGMLVLALGWALAFRSGVGVLLAVLTLVPLVARIRAEEALLLSQFGAAYEEYRAGTWRLAPGVY